jgi:hypothetical protein
MAIYTPIRQALAAEPAKLLSQSVGYAALWTGYNMFHSLFVPRLPILISQAFFKLIC